MSGSASASLCPASLTWTVHLARRRPGRAAGAAGVIAIGSVAAGVGFGSPILGALSLCLLTASVSDFLFPIHYRLTEDGVSMRGLLTRRKMEWRAVRRVVRDGLGVKLSPLPRHSRLEAYRGIYLWFSDQNSDEVMASITHHTSPEAAGGGDQSSV